MKIIAKDINTHYVYKEVQHGRLDLVGIIWWNPPESKWSFIAEVHRSLDKNELREIIDFIDSIKPVKSKKRKK